MIINTQSETVSFSALDSDRFGLRIARATLTQDTLDHAIDFCASEKIEMLIARCPTHDLQTVQDMERRGFELMDTLVYYRFDLTKRAVPAEQKKILVRSIEPGDEVQVRSVAAAAFRGYSGHYHADRRLDQNKCDEAYASWAERSCVPNTAADQVLVAEPSHKVVGFGTLRINSPKEVEGVLYAVAPECQGKGICGALMVGSLEWCQSQGAQAMIISTQITNVAMQRVWCRVGFEPMHAFYTFHKWFDPQ